MSTMKATLEELLVEDKQVHSHGLRLRLIEEFVKEARCEHCGLTEWNGKPIPLQLDHINGVRADNRLENLRILCPNCHTQTDTWGRKKTKQAPKHCLCGKAIRNRSERCATCYNANRSSRKKKIEWPPIDRLFLMVQADGYSQTARTLGVSDNAVRKHLTYAGVA